MNALTPLHHPCQALADLLTLRERFGELEGLRLAYVGDGNNVCHSLMLLGALAGVEVVVATPPELRPDAAIVRAGRRRASSVADDPAAAATGRSRALHGRLGEHGRREPTPSAAASCSRPTGSTRRCSRMRATTRSCCTACRRTRARRSPRTCSTASAPRSGTRPRTGCTPRRR